MDSSCIFDFVFSFDPEYGSDIFSALIPFSTDGFDTEFFCIIARGDSLDGSFFALDFDMASFVSPSISLERVGGLSDSGDIGLSNFLSSVSTGLVEYSSTNLVLIVFAALILACTPLMAWFGYRFLKRKVKNSVFKGRL